MTNDVAMLAHALKWRHWNGGDDEDIFVEFGVSAQQYYHRVRRMLTDPRGHSLEPSLVVELMTLCNNRITPPAAHAS
ncbi:DUF3263 domain-containing protein [Rhodococcus sp. NPDC003348]